MKAQPRTSRISTAFCFLASTNGGFTVQKGHCTRYESPQTRSLIGCPDLAILDLKIQRDKLHQYQKRIQTVLSQEKQLAKEALAQGNKSKALLILRRRKYQEQVLVKADQQLETLEQLVHTPSVWAFLTSDSID